MKQQLTTVIARREFTELKQTLEKDFTKMEGLFTQTMQKVDLTNQATQAENYFQAQKWTPLVGEISFQPDAPWKPAPGDRVQFTGARVDPLWAEAPISSVTIDLHTGWLTAQAGFPARQEINSLLDAIRFAPEDNLEEPAP